MNVLLIDELKSRICCKAKNKRRIHLRVTLEMFIIIMFKLHCENKCREKPPH